MRHERRCDQRRRGRFAGGPPLSRLLGNGPSRGELLSFLLFDEVFIAELIAAGARDAQRWLDRHPSFWCSGAAHDLDVSPGSAAARDAATLDEYRRR